MKSLLPFSLACLMSASAMAATPDLEGLNKDLEIMGTILQTTFKQSGKDSDMRVSNVTSTYLAGQGAVFSMRSRGGRWDFSHFLEGLELDVMIPEPPEPPEVVMELDDDDGMSDFEKEVHFITYSALDQAKEGLRVVHERLRDLGHNQRELEEDRRDLSYRQRDIKFEMKHADEKRAKELQAELKEVEDKLDKLQKEQAKVQESRAKLREESRKKEEEQQQKREATRKSFLTQFESGLGEALCRYGSGLRSLPANERVSIVLQQFGDEKTKRNRAQKDRIYVFKNSDIKSCVTEKISQKKLLELAEVYNF